MLITDPIDLLIIVGSVCGFILTVLIVIASFLIEKYITKGKE